MQVDVGRGVILQLQVLENDSVGDLVREPEQDGEDVQVPETLGVRVHEKETVKDSDKERVVLDGVLLHDVMDWEGECREWDADRVMDGVAVEENDTVPVCDNVRDEVGDPVAVCDVQVPERDCVAEVVKVGWRENE